MVRSSAPRAFKAPLRSYGTLGRERQRNRQFFSGMLRGVSNPREGSKILFFLFRSRVECSSPLHLRSSGKGCSTNFVCVTFSGVLLHVAERSRVRRVMSSSCSQPSPTKE
jgi:hypothetical protein